MWKCDEYKSDWTLEDANAKTDKLMEVLQCWLGIDIPSEYVADIIEMLSDNYKKVIHDLTWINWIKNVEELDYYPLKED